MFRFTNDFGGYLFFQFPVVYFFIKCDELTCSSDGIRVFVRVRGVSDWSQNSWNNEGQKVYNFTAELGKQMPESSDFLGKYNYEGNIHVDGMEFRFWSVKR